VTWTSEASNEDLAGWGPSQLRGTTRALVQYVYHKVCKKNDTLLTQTSAAGPGQNPAKR
jgi:hypothetical protein